MIEDGVIEDKGRNPEEPADEKAGSDPATGQTEDVEDPAADDEGRSVDQDSKDSFPASDPPAW